MVNSHAPIMCPQARMGGGDGGSGSAGKVSGPSYAPLSAGGGSEGISLMDHARAKAVEASEKKKLINSESAAKEGAAAAPAGYIGPSASVPFSSTASTTARLS